MITVPAEFAAARIARAGDTAERWIAALPNLVQGITREWGLELEDSAPFYGDNSLVLPVRRDDECYVLKVGWSEHAISNESIALAVWAGRGAVHVVEARPALGALLLERLDSGRSLLDLGLLDAAEVAGGLLRRLAVARAPAGIPKLREVAERIADSLPERQKQLGNPVRRTWLEAASGLARELGADTGARLIHADLHYGNVFAGPREPWLAIDPRPVAGDPEYAVPELLWTRLDEVANAPGVRRLLAALVDSGELRAEVARGWAIVRCVGLLAMGS
jgi:streptomycin 6-kinase